MPWRCRRPDRDSYCGLGMARGVRPLIPPGRLDSSGLTSPFLVEQLLVVEAVVDGLHNGLHGKPIFPGNFFGRERFPTHGFAVKNLCPDSTIYEYLPVVR